VAITHAHSATVWVADQDAALDFYVNKLGWEKAFEVPMGDGVRFLTIAPAGRAMPGQATQLSLAPRSWLGEGENPPVNTGITFIADDIDATYAELVERGVKFKGPVEVMPWGMKATWLYDIDGNEFFLTQE